MMVPATYPVQFAVDYPDRPLDRLTSFFRLIVAIPILIVLGAVTGGTLESSNDRTRAAVVVGQAGCSLLARC
jgi:hypothetical protein